MMRKIALVIGSSRGIGEGIAKYLLKKNYFVYVTYNVNKKLAEKSFRGDINEGNCKVLNLTLPTLPSIIKVYDEINTDFGKLDLLVNSAAIEHPGRSEQLEYSNWRELFDVGLFGRFLCIKKFLYLLKVSKGIIINITSSMAYLSDPDFSIYCVMQAAIVNYSKTCAVDFAKYGIRCHTVNPGVVRTNMWKVIGEYDNKQFWEKIKISNPLSKICTPEDVGKAVYLLTLPEAEYLNGNEIYVNGGSHLT